MNNWERHKIVIFAAILVFLGSDTIFAAKVKKKDGQIIEGNINGVVLLKQKGTTKYHVFKGEDVESIDENGVRLRSGSKFLHLVTLGDKDEAGTIGLAYAFFSSLGDICNNPGRFFNIDGASGNCLDGKELNATGILLGVLKDQKGKNVIDPSLKIVTSTGTIVVPLNEIVATRNQ